MLHIILPDFSDYKSLKPGAKDKIIFIAPEDGNSTFGAEALILCSKAKTEVISVGTSSPVRMAYEIGRMAGNEKGEVTVHSSNKEMACLTIKKATRAPKAKQTPAAKEDNQEISVPKRIKTDVQEKENPAVATIPVPTVKETKQAPRKISKEESAKKNGKVNDGAIMRILKANHINSNYLPIISEQFSKEGASSYTIDVFVRTAVVAAGVSQEEANKIGELIKKHWNEVIR